MRKRLRVIVFVVASLLVMAGAALAESIFVDRTSQNSLENGSATAPFKTITQALKRAREIRFLQPSTAEIIVHVAAGTYVGSFETPTPAGMETLPLLLNIPRVRLEGALRFDPTFDMVVPGTQTIVRAFAAQAGKQHMLVVTRTNPIPSPVSPFPPSLEMAGDSVIISGFLLDGAAGATAVDAPSAEQSALIFLDGVNGFIVRDSVLTGANVFGISTRLSSGRIEHNSITGNRGVGLNITGGSMKFPATIVITRNRVTNNGLGGLGLQGAAQTEGDLASLFAAQAFRRVPLPEFFDWTHRPEEVPDKLDATITNNVFSNNTNGSTTNPRGFGIRVNGYLRDNYRLHPLDPERLIAFVRARFVSNVCRLNGNYGVVVDAGQVQTSNSRKHVVNFDVSFEDTTVAENGSGNAFFGFSRFSTSVSQDEASKVNFKFAHDSTMRICSDIGEFNFDNSATDPVDQTPTNNVLTVNRTPLQALCVPRVNSCVRALTPAEAAVDCK